MTTATAARRVEVRVARPGDAATVAAIHIAAWRRAYAHVVPAAALTGIPPGDREGMWRRLIAGGGDRRRVLVAGARDGAPRGFAAWSPTRDADGDPETTAELCAIYVHPDAWGGGVGRALVERGTVMARADRFWRATLWVVRDNPRARRFYERAGWTDDGGRREEPVLGEPVAQVRYAIDLGRPAGG